MSVNDRAFAIATFRFISVRLMEIVARWTPTTPEMEVKIVFGRHIWDFAQHADILGKRTFELRQPEQFSKRPVDAYVALLDNMAELKSTSERLGALYDGLLPELEKRYRDYIAVADPILDEPTIIIFDRIVADLQRMRDDANNVRRDRAIATWDAASIASAERSIERIVA
jgi:hypothetical protein